MKISLRTAVAAGTIAALGIAGALIAGPASANGKADAVKNAQQFSLRGGQGGPGFMGGMMGGFDNDTATIGPMLRGRGEFGGPGMMRGRGEFGGPGMMRGGAMLHSEGVVAQRDASGNVTYVTVRMQQGKVTAADAASITVQSDDKVSYIWPITSTTKLFHNGALAKATDFAVGDLVMANGTVASGGAVTTNIIANHPARPVQPAPKASTSSSTASNT